MGGEYPGSHKTDELYIRVAAMPSETMSGWPGLRSCKCSLRLSNPKNQEAGYAVSIVIHKLHDDSTATIPIAGPRLAWI